MSTSSTVIEKMDAAISWLSSSDPKVVSKGLNFLLAKSVDGFENSAHIAVVAAECCPKLIIALGDLMEVVNPLGTLLYKPSSVDEDYFSIMLSSPKFDEEMPPSVYSTEFKFLSRYVDDNPVLLSCLTILRNISFEATSEPLLAFSTSIVRQLVSLVCLGSQSNAMTECTFLAFDILTRLAHRIDLFGKRRMQFSNQVMESLDHTSLMATKLRLAPPFASSTTTEYIMSVRMILPAVFHIIRRPGNVCELQERGFNRAVGLRTGQPGCRALLISAMELLGRLVANPDNHTFLLQCPRLLVESLVHLLLVSHTRGDGLVAEAHAAQGDPFGRFRPPAAVLLPRLPKPLGQVHAVPATISLQQSNLFGMDYVDVEIRDLALDLLGALCKLSRENALGLVPSAVPYLLRIAQAMPLPEYVPLSAFTSSRPESAQKAIGLLQILVLMPESDQAFRAAKTELLLAACRDDVLADLVLNKGHPAFISLIDNELQDVGEEVEMSGVAPTLQTSDTTLTLA